MDRRLKMFQLKNYIKYFGLFLMTSIIWSCQENEIPAEEDVPEGMTRITLLLPDYNGGSGKFNTRAYNTEEEGYMSNLYVVAIKYSSYNDVENVDGTIKTEEKELDTPQVFTYSLNSIGESFVVDEKDASGNDKYHSFNVTLYPGRYKFGVIANVDLYLERTTKVYNFTKESDFENIVLNFKENTPLSPLHLPMLCTPWEIKYSQMTNGNIRSEILQVDKNKPFVEIRKDNNVRLYANMKFQCAKVRYTILFDKTEGGISESFGESWIRFNVDDQNKPTAHNLRTQTLLVPEKYGTSQRETGVYNPDYWFIHQNDDPANENLANWTMSIDRYYWSGPEWSEDPDWKTKGTSHGNEGADYPKRPDSTLDFYRGTTATWVPMKQKVWQGVVYLPENMPEEGSSNFEQTYLEFPYHTRANDWDDTPEEEAKVPKKILLFGNANETHFSGTAGSAEYVESDKTLYAGIQRGFFYDVVAKIVNPEQDMIVQVFVNIIPWHEIDQNVEDSNAGSRPKTETEMEANVMLNQNINNWEHGEFQSVW